MEHVLLICLNLTSFSENSPDLFSRIYLAIWWTEGILVFVCCLDMFYTMRVSLQLAMTQTRWVEAELRKIDPELDIEIGRW